MLVTPPTIDKITIGRYASPIGIGESRPRLSWRFAQDSSTSPNFVQRKYELEIFRDDLGSAVYFPTSEINVGVPWPSDTERDEKPLKSREKGTIHVRACGEDELWTEWHKQEFEVGLLEDEDWSAEFVTTDIKPPSQLTKRPFYTRTEFRLDQTALDGMRKDGRGARIYATALGVYQLELNGHRVGDHVLAPGWQSYNHRLHYQTYVVPAELFKHGDNVIGAVVGEGWYAGHLTWSPYFRNIWGEEIGVRVQLEFPGGVSNLTVAETISSGEGWQWTYGPLLASELYDGETFDVSLIDPKWSTIESKSIWRPVKTLPLPSSTKLIAPEAPPIRRMLEVKPTELISTPKGKKIIDFGQNIAGWAKVKIIPPGSGKVVTLRFAEVLDRGELGVRPLRSAKATDTVFLGPNEVKDWEPSFTTHGFRYLEVNGMEAELENFIAVVVHSDMERLGDFRCSHEMINKLHENVVWGLRGNFVGVPTDCPQRDER